MYFAGKVQFISIKLGGFLYFKTTQKQLNKGVETQDKEGIQLFLWISFLVPCETNGMNIHSIQSKTKSIMMELFFMVCLIHGDFDVK